MAKPRWVTEIESTFYQIGDTWTLEGDLVHERLGTQLTPTAATVTITHAGGGSLTTAVTDAPMTISGNRVSYAFAAGNLVTPERYLQAKITVTISSVEYTITHFFDAVRVAPMMTADLKEVARGAPGIPELGTQEDPSAQQVHREAWEDVIEWVRSAVGYPDLVLDHRVLRAGHVLRSRYLLYARASRSADDAYAHQAERNLEEWVAWTKRAQLPLDVDQSGTIDETEHPRSVAVVDIGRREVGEGPVHPGLRFR